MKVLVFLLMITTLPLGLIAQKGAFGEDIKTEEEKIEEKIDKVTGEKKKTADANTTAKSGENRVAPSKGKAPLKPMGKTYSVLLFQSNNPIDITHKAMKTYGTKLFYRQIPEGDYYYMIGEFKTETEAKAFLKKVKITFPKASLVNDIDYPHIKL